MLPPLQTSVSLYRVTGMYLILRRVVLLCVTLSMIITFVLLFTSIRYLHFILTLASIQLDLLLGILYSHAALLFPFIRTGISAGAIVGMMWSALLFHEHQKQRTLSQNQERRGE